MNSSTVEQKKESPSNRKDLKGTTKKQIKKTYFSE